MRVRKAVAWIASAGVVVFTAALWYRGYESRPQFPGGVSVLLAAGSLSGLVAALAALMGLVITARTAVLEQAFGHGRLLRAHRLVGIVCIVALLVHCAAETLAWLMLTSDSLAASLASLLLKEPWMPAAVAATGLLLLVAITSWRRARVRLSYETWYFIHVLGYLAVVLGFGHQLTVGGTFQRDPVAAWWWIALTSMAFATVLISRVRVIRRSFSMRMKVVSVSIEDDGLGTLCLEADNGSRNRAKAGQFFVLRPLTGDLWWQAHPYSLSAVPRSAQLEFTIGAKGDDSAKFLRLPPGTTVLAEGPYGDFTIDRAQGNRIVLIGGGAGIGPILALLEESHPSQCPLVIIRVRQPLATLRRRVMEQLVDERGGRLVLLDGPREGLTSSDLSDPRQFLRWAPDVAERDAFVCGPRSLESVVRASLLRAGVPARRIHRESFGI